MEGIFEFIIFSICLVSFCIFGLSANSIEHPDNLIQYFNEFDYNDFIICLTTIIVFFIYNISIILTCDYLTPIHILIVSIITETYSIFETSSNLALNFLGFFILILIFIMLLVFIEVIEINICKLSYNIKRNIELRSQKDILIEFGSASFVVKIPELDE